MKNEQSETLNDRDEIEALLPWYVSGKLDPNECARVDRYLEAHPEIRAVTHPGLPSHPQHAVAQRQLRAGGGMLAADVGSRARATAFIDGLAIPPATATLGSVITYAVHPPSSTHRQLGDTELASAGIPPGLVRISVGLEDVADLVADFDTALDAVARTGVAA